MKIVSTVVCVRSTGENYIEMIPKENTYLTARIRDTVQRLKSQHVQNMPFGYARISHGTDNVARTRHQEQRTTAKALQQGRSHLKNRNLKGNCQKNCHAHDGIGTAQVFKKDKDKIIHNCARETRFNQNARGDVAVQARWLVIYLPD